MQGVTTLSTSSDQPEALEGWSQHSLPAFSEKWPAPRSEDGRLVLEPTSSGWIEDIQAGHLYRPVDGNFIVTAKLRVEGTKTKQPQTLFSLTGVFIRVPREGLKTANWEPAHEDCVFWRGGGLHSTEASGNL